MMTAITDASKSLIQALKDQPMALALLVLNLAFLAFVGWLTHEVSGNMRTEREQRQQMILTLMQQCGSVKPPS